MISAPPCSFAGSQFLLLLDVARRWGVTAAELLDGSGLTETELAAPSSRVSLDAGIHLACRARKLTNEPALGVYLGLSQRPAHWGYLGLATASSPTMRAALELAVRYSTIVSPAFSLSLKERGGMAELVADEEVSFGGARDIFVLAMLVGIHTVGRAMTGKDFSHPIECALPPPPYADRLRGMLPPFRFGQPRNRFYFDVAALDLPYQQQDPLALRLFVVQCEEQLDENVFSVGARVRRLVRGRGASLPSLEDVALVLGTSARTLKRKLASEGLSYRGLIDDERRVRALAMVRSSRSLSEIASRLGYSSVSNFERAFRRWTTRAPGEYRR